MIFPFEKLQFLYILIHFTYILHMVGSFFLKNSVDSLILDWETTQEKLKTRCLYSDWTARIFKREENIKEWDILVKIVSSSIQQRFLIEDIAYQWWTWSFEPTTKLKIRNINVKLPSTKTIHAQYYSEGNQTINNNPSPLDLMAIIAEREVEHKKEIITLLKEFEKTKDKSKLTKIIELIANTSQILWYIWTLF